MFRFIILFFVGAALAVAHVGNPAVVYDGMAGPYSVRVIVVPPPVVPGRAEINARLLQPANDALKITVLPVNAYAGLAGAPPADETKPVAGEPGLQHGELWLMSAGSYSVHVTVKGERGEGTVIVPVVAAATRVLPMATALKVVLVILGIVLFCGAVTLVGVGVRDSVLAPGVALDAAKRRVGGLAVAITAVVLGLGVYGGKCWWDDVDANYRHNEIYRASPLAATIASDGDKRVLRLSVSNEGTYGGDRLELIPDHGKLMHLFMVREPQLDVLAHLHPARSGPRSFDVTLPSLPDGKYRLYSDITYETGFAATLTGVIDLAREETGARGEQTAPAVDPDDSWYVASAGGDRPGVYLALSGSNQFKKGEDVGLQFRATDASGAPVSIEPYMGMMGHAAVRRSDGSVFAHLHPTGTVSMAAEQFFSEQRDHALGLPPAMDHSMHMHMHMHHGSETNSVSFPFVFPQAGAYRVWAQVKVGGEVVTGVADVTVE